MEEKHQNKLENMPIITEDVRWIFNKKAHFWIAKRKKLTGFEDKTLWDKLNFFGTLAIPLIIALATIGFSVLQLHLADVAHQQDVANATLQHQRDQAIALDQQRATILQTYIDNIQGLLLDHGLQQAHPQDELAILARARTLTALQGLDVGRKSYLVLFLYEAHLIGFPNNDPNIDLSSAPLNHVDFTGANLTGANLSSVNLDSADFSRANLTGSVLADASVSKATFSGTILNKANLSGANLSGANLSGAKLCLLVFSISGCGATLMNANLSSANLDTAKLSEVNFSGANLSRTKLIDAKLNGAELNKANLSNADFSGADFSASNHCAIYLNEGAKSGCSADLSGANLSGANLGEANLGGANLSGADLSNANLSGANLDGANLSNADLSGYASCPINLSVEVSSTANFSSCGVNLQNARLSGANLNGTNLTNAQNLTQQQLNAVSSCVGAVLPSGLTCP